MTVHQPFYNIDLQVMKEIYILWTVAALIIVLGTLFLIFMVVSDKISRYRAKKKQERIEKTDKEFYDNLGKTVYIGVGVDRNGVPTTLTKDEFDEMQKYTKKYEREIE